MDAARSKIIGLIVMLVICDSALTLRCMNCTSMSLSPVVGCHEGFAEEFMTDCPSDSTHCQVLRYEGSFGDSGIIQYERICASEFREECIAVDDAEYDGVTCSFSCDVDGCNALNIFPNEPEYTTPAPPTATTVENRQEALLRCYVCTSDPSLADGCEEGLLDEYVVDCLPKENFCLVTKYDSDKGHVYRRSCSSVDMNSCVETQDSGLVCHSSCDSDGCNTQNIFPNKPEDTTPASTTLTPVEDKQDDLLRCYKCTSNPLYSDDCKERLLNKYLMDCLPEEKFCLVKKYNTDNGMVYKRACSVVDIQSCVATLEDGVACHRSCNSDGCNNEELQFPMLQNLIGSSTPAPDDTTTSKAIKHRVNFALSLACISAALIRFV